MLNHFSTVKKAWGHAWHYRREETFPCRTKLNMYQKRVCFNASLKHSIGQEPSLCQREGVHLSGAQAAICCWTEASLNVIWPRPAHAAAPQAPQRGLPTGTVLGGGMDKQRHGVVLWPGPWPGGADRPDRQHHVCFEKPLLSVISHAAPMGLREDGRSEWTQWGGRHGPVWLPPLIHLWEGSFYSLWTEPPSCLVPHNTAATTTPLIRRL